MIHGVICLPQLNKDFNKDPIQRFLLPLGQLMYKLDPNGSRLSATIYINSLDGPLHHFLLIRVNTFGVCIFLWKTSSIKCDGESLMVMQQQKMAENTTHKKQKPVQSLTLANHPQPIDIHLHHPKASIVALNPVY